VISDTAGPETLQDYENLRVLVSSFIVVKLDAPIEKKTSYHVFLDDSILNEFP